MILYDIFRAYHTQGMYAAEIARTLGISKTAVRLILLGKRHPELLARWRQETVPESVMQESARVRSMRVRCARITAGWRQIGVPKSLDGIFTIYGLVDPRDHEIRYVGQTRREPSVRLREHLEDRDESPKRDWLASLQQVGLMPTIRVLEADLDGLASANERERYWVAHCRQETRLPLLNVLEGGQRGTLPPDVIEKIRQTLQQKFRDPVFKARVLAARRTPDVMARQKARWGSAEFRNERSRVQRARMANQEVRATIQREVECSDGRVWSSVKACATDFHVTSTTICRALRSQKPFRGIVLRYRKEPQSA